jgi:polyisoprenyl-phosphate glycosyltransferase
MVTNQQTMNPAIKLALVLPCFNENESVGYAASELSTLLKEMADEGLVSRNSYILFVDDGSTDETWATILQLHGNNNGIKGLKLSRNFGHQAALLAGLTSVVNECQSCNIS